MRPRERSYGDISTLTRSPTRMRMRCLRILPEIAANTTCELLSSRTLKNALGCLSIIVPSAGTRSSFANQFLLVFVFKSLFLVMLGHAVLKLDRNNFPVRHA